MNYLFRSSAKFLNRVKFQVRPYNYFCFSNQPQQQNAEVLEEVRARIFQVLKSAAKCKQDKLTDKASFEELGFDSLDSVELVVALEENFGFDIQNTEAEQIQGVADAIAIFYKYTFSKLNSEALTETKTEK